MFNLLKCNKTSYGFLETFIFDDYIFNNSIHMEDKKLHYRHLMLHFYIKGKNAAQTAKTICEVYGEGALSARTVCKWFANFKVGNYNLEDGDRSGRPVTVDDKRILELMEAHPDYSTRKVAEILQVSHASVKRRLKSLKFECYSKGQK